MAWILAADQSMADWANTVIAILGLCAALIALHQSRHSNQTAKEANELSRAANGLAAKAIGMQEDESTVRIVVKPRLVCVIGEGEDSSPRPAVEVINLSVFPVTIEKICWKLSDNRWLFWKNPTITNPFAELPARLPPREAFTALGTPTSFESLKDHLQTITSAVVFTACGEQIGGMTQEWQDEVRRMVDGEKKA